MHSCTVYSMVYILSNMATTNYCKVYINKLKLMFTMGALDLSTPYTRCTLLYNQVQKCTL